MELHRALLHSVARPPPYGEGAYEARSALMSSFLLVFTYGTGSVAPRGRGRSAVPRKLCAATGSGPV